MATVEAQLASWSTDGTGTVRILEGDDESVTYYDVDSGSNQTETRWVCSSQLHKGNITHSGTEASAEAAAKVVLNNYVTGSRGKSNAQQAKETRLGI
tara:strand:+ start:1022 stop:1312 length:291 start_codon:yes stop_codon:yes gene_type:complete